MRISNPVKLTTLLVILVIILLSAWAYADEEAPDASSANNRLFVESGIITGFGTSDIADGDYQPILLIWHLGIDMKRFSPGLENHRGTLSFYLEPQINPVVNHGTDIECGVGLGFKYMYPITDNIFTYIIGGIGPHYVSVVTKDQANGFIFSDTIGAGFYYFLPGNTAINIGYRFRHMSNAGLAHPNYGVETHFGTIGYSIFF